MPLPDGEIEIGWHHHEPSLMFWAGAGATQEPSLSPDGPAPA